MTGDKSLLLGNANIGGRRLYVKGMQNFAYSIKVDGLAPRRFRYDRAASRATSSPTVLRHGKQSKLTVKRVQHVKVAMQDRMDKERESEKLDPFSLNHSDFICFSIPDAAGHSIHNIRNVFYAVVRRTYEPNG